MDFQLQSLQLTSIHIIALDYIVQKVQVLSKYSAHNILQQFLLVANNRLLLLLEVTWDKNKSLEQLDSNPNSFDLEFIESFQFRSYISDLAVDSE